MQKQLKNIDSEKLRTIFRTKVKEFDKMNKQNRNKYKSGDFTGLLENAQNNQELNQSVSEATLSIKAPKDFLN